MTTAFSDTRRPKYHQYQPESSTGQDTPVVQTSRQADMQLRMDALLREHPQERLAAMMQPPWHFNEEHIRRVNAASTEILGDRARDEIRETARISRSLGEEPSQAALKWFTREKYDEMMAMLLSSDLPDHLIASEYIYLEVFETAHAEYALIHLNETGEFEALLEEPETDDDIAWADAR